MTDKEKIMSFEKYLREKGLDNETVKFYVHVVSLLVSEVLFYFEQTLDNIDTYCFEEFTDMVGLIDDEFGGREGLPKMIQSMQELTEFLKINKFIKGGKIAYYKRMFGNTEYYLDKYDMMTGKKDDTKDFIKTITSNSFSANVIKLADEINLYEIETLNRVDNILNDVPFGKKEMCEEIKIIMHLLVNLNLMEEKNGQFETTKKGRALSRLAVEERYAALLYLFIYNANWNNILNRFYGDDIQFDFKSIFGIFASIFSKTSEVAIKIDDIKKLSDKEALVEISSMRFRIAKAEAIQYGSNIIDICLTGFGLLDIQNNNYFDITYRVNNFSQSIFKLIMNDYAWYMRNEIETIGYMIKNKKYDKAEQLIIEYLSTYGDNIIVWDYLGQILLLKKDYLSAYSVLKHSYEVSSKKGKGAKTTLYHLVLCCRKLKLPDDIQSYEEKLQTLEKI